ncbi:MAG: hypothetical protein E7598_00875 [Ruminococcaceae bacterium]|nr:hypothetical protein [Oscillospiraceae bacterium]
MKTIELWLGRYDSEYTLFNAISTDFGITPKVYSIDSLAEFLKSNSGHFVNIRYSDRLYGDAAIVFADIIKLFEQIKLIYGNLHLDYSFVPREKVVIDFAKCQSMSEIYQEMRVKMEWMDWYGENLDALWDILTGLPYKGDDFTILRKKHHSRIIYGRTEDFTGLVDEICGIFIEAQNEYGKIKVDIHFS